MKIKWQFFILVFGLVSTRVGTVYAQNVIDRSSEVIIMTGDRMEGLIGAVPHDVVGFRREGTVWKQIPVQIDERDSVDAETIYGHTPVEEFLNENWGTDLDKLVILTYTDTATFTGPDKDPLFDENDEFLFMARDAGPRYTGTEAPAQVDPSTKIEIRLVDPLTGDKAFVYLFIQDGSLDPSAGKKYVDYRFNLLSGNYKETYTIGGNFDPEDSYVTTNYYQTHFSDRWVKDRLMIPANGATAYDTINILDRHKTLLEPNNCGRTEVVFSSQEGAFVTNKSGPIRAIRSYFGANSGPLDQRQHFFYEQSEEITFYLRMHSIRGIVDIMDHTRSAIGMKYKNNNNPDWIIFDGVPEAINKGRIHWELLTGEQGTWISFSSISHNFNITDVSETYYEDNLTPIDIQCTGDNEAIGSVGHLIPIRIPLTDPRGNTSNRLSLTRVNYYQAPHLDESYVFELDKQRKNPVAACAGDCGAVPVSPTNLVVADTAALSVRLTWTDNSAQETGFVIERAEEELQVFVQVGTVAANVTSYTDNGLTQSTDYRYKVKAINGEAASGYTNIVELKTKRDFEAAPTELQMIGRTATTISLAWEDNTSNESAFLLERTGPGDNQQFFAIATIPANDTSYVDENLLPDNQYSYRIMAAVEPLNTTFSNILHAKTAGDAPEAPSGLDYQARGVSLISLVWQDNSGNEDGFIIERALGDSNEIVFRDTLGIGATGYTDTGLESKTIYRYKVRAYNEGGSNSSDILATKTAGEKPLAPGGLFAGAHSKTKVVLEWTDNALDEAGYIIERSNSDNVQQLVVIDTVGKDITIYEDVVDLDTYNYYMYRVKAYNEDGLSEPSNNARTTIVTGIEDEISKSIQLYPNPGDGIFMLKMQMKHRETIDISIHDSLGRRLFNQAEAVSMPAFSLPLNLTSFSPGTYFVTIKGENFNVVKRIIKL